MVELTVNLTPALTGVKSEMWVGLLVGQEVIWYYVLDIPILSVNGVIGPFAYTDPYTPNLHAIRFPEQTINGKTYEATSTSNFMITQDRVFDITLTEIVEPPPTPPPQSVIAIITAAATGMALIILCLI